MASKVKTLISKVPRPGSFRKKKEREKEGEEDATQEEAVETPQRSASGLLRSSSTKKQEQLRRQEAAMARSDTSRKVELECLAVLESAIDSDGDSDDGAEGNEAHGADGGSPTQQWESQRTEGERRVFFVWKGGPLTLEGAVDVSVDGDKVVISPGTYEDIYVVCNKSIELCTGVCPLAGCTANAHNGHSAIPGFPRALVVCYGRAKSRTIARVAPSSPGSPCCSKVVVFSKWCCKWKSHGGNSAKRGSWEGFSSYGLPSLPW